MDTLDEHQEKSAQVCDHCRRRKIKCDGILPTCSNCAQAKISCTFSTQLRRKTKRRGHDPQADLIQNLQAEIANLRLQIQTQTQNTARLSSSGKRARTNESSRQPDNANPGPIFRHLGRLVCPEDGVDQFAGSSTGVHFTLSAQTKYQTLFSSHENFPEAVFSLYLIKNCRLHIEDTHLQTTPSPSSLISVFSRPKSFYLSKIEIFFGRWSQLYPILARKQFFAGVDHIFNSIESPYHDIETDDEIILYQLCVILAVVMSDETTSDTCTPGGLSRFYYSFAQGLYHRVAAIGNLASLQGLLLLLVYYQQTNHHHLANQTIGSVVRLAQSLGLHRHARRFRFCVGETETRKRLWWCVYIFDVMISLQYGLPKIIQNEDEDNDLPIDCDFDDMTLTQLPLPLPGESTKMSPFICYIRLSRILSSILKDLYTTTRRRNGVQKIQQLTRELQVWDSISETTIGKFDDTAEHDEGNNSDNNKSVISKWLHLLGRISLIYVHRPALTFDSNEPQFQTSLELCSKTAISIISALQKFREEDQIFNMFPSGAHFIFQCALLCIYRTWHHISAEGSDFQSTEKFNHQSNTVEVAASLLDYISHHNNASDEHSGKPGPLTQASWVLRHLSMITVQRLAANQPQSSHSGISPTTMESYDFTTNVTNHGFESLSFTGGQNGESVDLFLVNEHGLDYLNQMDESTWTFLPQLGGEFSAEAEVGPGAGVWFYGM